MDAAKKHRSSNWTEQEKKVLRELVMERAEVIENKDTSGYTNTAKKKAWGEVLTCFNTINAHKRDLNQLLNQWRNMKNRAKKSDFAYRKAQTQTGGGPPPTPPPPEDLELITLLPQEFVVDHNIYDCDSIHKNQKPGPNEKPRSGVSMDTTIMPSKRRHPLIKQSGKKKKNNRDCECQTSHEHQLFVMAQKDKEAAIERLDEEHLIRLQLMNEEHKNKMKLIDMEVKYLQIKIKKLES